MPETVKQHLGTLETDHYAIEQAMGQLQDAIECKRDLTAPMAEVRRILEFLQEDLTAAKRDLGETEFREAVGLITDVCKEALQRNECVR
jgi:hypothetical protein